MTSIICLTETISCKEFRSNYLKNKKLFRNSFCAFLKYILNYKHLPKKGDPRSPCVSGNTRCKKYGEMNVQKALFQRTIRQTTQQMGRKSLAI